MHLLKCLDPPLLPVVAQAFCEQNIVLLSTGILKRHGKLTFSSNLSGYIITNAMRLRCVSQFEARGSNSLSYPSTRTHLKRNC